MKKEVIFLFGQPGAGKGTQAELLAEKLGYYHLESSKVIENSFKPERINDVVEVEGETFKVSDEKKIWEAGNLNSPPFVQYLISKRIQELANDDKSIIFSGNPRTVYEVEREIPLIKNLYGEENIHFLMLEISAKTTMFRNSHRRVCELIRHSILFSPETEKLALCPLDGSKLVKRKGGLDTPEIIKHRLDVYEKQTRPVLDVVEKLGINIHRINGEQSVSDVHEEVLKAIS